MVSSLMLMSTSDWGFQGSQPSSNLYLIHLRTAIVSIFYRVTSNGKLRMITEIIRSAILYLDTQLIFST